MQRIVIAGGGVIGLALAFRLLEAPARARVLVVDSGAPSATAAAAGMLAPSFEHGASPEALTRFGRASLLRWRNFAPALEAASGEAIDYRADGVLGLAFGDESAATLRLDHERLAARGVRAELLLGRAAREREPGLSERVMLALFVAEDGQVDARRTAHALKAAVKVRGGAFHDGEVAAVETKAGKASTVLLAGGERLSADAVVLAAGAAVRRIRSDAPAPPIFPVKGEAVALHMPRGAIRHVVRAPGAYLCPKADGRLVIGATEVKGDESLAPSAPAVAALKSAAAKAVPAVAAYSEAERWAGLRPATPDGAPILGRDPRGPEALYCALGHYRNGVLLAPESAETLARLILDGEEDGFLADFRPDRFSSV